VFVSLLLWPEKKNTNNVYQLIKKNTKLFVFLTLPPLKEVSRLAPAILFFLVFFFPLQLFSSGVSGVYLHDL
jgi:hypothetical protein